MATRTIVTSQPDVACDVCERRLLRGEQPDIFLAAGRRRTVCELCAPRAAHEGWLRERDSQSVTLAPLRARRGRSFFERLRQVARPSEETGPGPAPEAVQAETAQAYDFLEGYGRATAAPVAATPRREPDLADPGEIAAGLDGTPAGNGTAAGAPYLERALGVFNVSEYPRRVAGVARSLGAPAVSVRSAEHLESVVVIVVAWELSWYRYEVDLSEELPVARVSAQGTELGELEREERVSNGLATESGRLALAAA